MEIKFYTSAEMKAQEKLIEAVAEIYLENNFIYSPTLYERFKTESEGELRTKLRQRVLERVEKGYNFYLLFEDDSIIGFNNHRVKRSTIKSNEFLCLEVGTTCISPQHQNRGYGKELYALLDYDALERYNVEAITRITWSTNTRQVHLYNLYDYKVYIQKYDFYGFEGVDCLHFYKMLNENPTGNITQGVLT